MRRHPRPRRRPPLHPRWHGASHRRRPLPRTFLLPETQERTGKPPHRDHMDAGGVSRHQGAHVSHEPAGDAGLPGRRRKRRRMKRLLRRPDDVESCRHIGERRYPVSESNRQVDSRLCTSFARLRRGDEFNHQRARSIGAVLFLTCSLLAACDGNCRAMPDSSQPRLHLCLRERHDPAARPRGRSALPHSR